MSEVTDTQAPNISPSAATGGSGLERPYCAYCDGYHEEELSCAEKLSLVRPKAEYLTVDDLWTAIPQMNRCKVSFAMLKDTVTRLNKMGGRIVRECREEGAPEQETIGGVHVRGFSKMPKSTQDAMVAMCEKAQEAIVRGDFDSQNASAELPPPSSSASTQGAVGG